MYDVTPRPCGFLVSRNHLQMFTAFNSRPSHYSLFTFVIMLCGDEVSIFLQCEMHRSADNLQDIIKTNVEATSL